MSSRRLVHKLDVERTSDLNICNQARSGKDPRMTNAASRELPIEHGTGLRKPAGSASGAVHICFCLGTELRNTLCYYR
jgi:hypothetical protein